MDDLEAKVDSLPDQAVARVDQRTGKIIAEFEQQLLKEIIPEASQEIN